MKCWKIGLFCLVTAATAAQAMEEPESPPLHGRLLLRSTPQSAILGRKITTWVYLPPGYQSTGERYPVVYLLHGQPGGWTDCYRSGRIEEMADHLIATRQMQPMILVAFDADGPRGQRDLTNFCNRATDGYRVEDFIVRELVPYVDATYRTRPAASQRALLGYSAGGYGALNLGLKHPDLFSVLCSHGGFYSPQDERGMMLRILGPEGPLWQANNPLVEVKQLMPGTPLHVYMDASEREDGFEEFRQLLSELQTRGADCLTLTFKKAHSWRVVSEHCRDSLLFANRCFAAGGGAVVASAGSQ